MIQLIQVKAFDFLKACQELFTHFLIYFASKANERAREEIPRRKAKTILSSG
jgi:hypothetical protein